MIRIGTFIFFMVLLSLSINSCGPSAIYQNDFSLDGPWSYDQVFESEISIQDTSLSYDLLLELDHIVDFEYQNLYVNITTTFPDGKEITSPLSLELSDRKGNWLGECNSSNCTIQFYLKENFKFKALGIHNISISQASRFDGLKGLNGLELKLFNTP